MLFNSIEFALFLPLVFGLYWLLSRFRVGAQNLLLLGASYVFYGWWDWRFLSLIAFSSVVDFGAGIAIERSRRNAWRRAFLCLSLAVNLGLLGAFKYWGFFIGSMADLLETVGFQVNPWSLQVILPVGISFYTFQTMSYTIDVYRGKISAAHDPLAYFAYVSFFPQLVAGPIERAANLLPQFRRPRHFDYTEGVLGLRLILWGLVKKVIIADHCAHYVNEIFASYSTLHAPQLVMGTVFFAFQIYGDFSGYSDIAIGTAKLFGFDLMTNFRRPYFSRDIAEFWRRWHISLSTWFRDYVYIPLGGSRCNKPRAVFNTIVVFVVSGLWHGANWTFVFWGALNALYFIPLLLTGVNRRHTDGVAQGRLLPSAREALGMAATFALVCFAWIFFRAESLGHAFGFLSRMLSDFVAHPGGVLVFARQYARLPLVWLLIGFVVLEWLTRDEQPILRLHRLPMAVRWSAYVIAALAVVFSMPFGAPPEFIYFQF